MQLEIKRKLGKQYLYHFIPNGPNSHIEKIHPTTAEYTFFLSTHGTFYSIDYMLVYKKILSRLKVIEIILTIISNHKSMKLEVSKRRKSEILLIYEN